LKADNLFFLRNIISSQQTRAKPGAALQTPASLSQ
jgi:hypothetical protein